MYLTCLKNDDNRYVIASLREALKSKGFSYYALERVDDGTSGTKNHPLNGWR